MRRVVGWVRAVDGVGFTIPAGGTLGVVGESGSGKSTVAKAIVGLVPVRAGSIRYGGEELVGLSRARRHPFRKRIQMIFQDPMGSLNPRMTVEAILSEPLEIHFPELDRAARRARAVELLERVDLDAGQLNRYPHEFSGGQRQRVGIARALAVEPELLICDEAVSALDVSVQAQIVNLLKDLQQDLGLTYLFISHDLAVVEFMSDHIVVMREGKVEEQADRETLYRAPQSDYTRRLLAAVPRL